jgi:hypothetical protein
MFTNFKTKLLLSFLVLSSLLNINKQLPNPDMYIVYSSYIVTGISFTLLVAISGNKRNFITNNLARIFTSLEFH